ncbi:MAG: adaptin N terminal region-domain-containing protein [Olpidium bornovanus]|uniref:Adaptin N terminal region-domain-containing protein n=1 Tax=Olpidium bornovanus TaxID=278681 RepID=A0A8H7ZV38_9FUNG|nr:MAG: adaptin N terminal region-domain-containing protein [Olpidium bornovanus]
MSAADYLAGMGHNAAKAAARLSERASKALIEGSRAAGLDGQAHYFETSEEKLREIRKTLESTNDRDKLDGLQRLTAVCGSAGQTRDELPESPTRQMVSKGRNVSEFFPNVVKNVASTNLQVRKLVYIYLLRYAEQEPDLALLSVNTFQKDLTDPSPIIRAMALRVMSGIRVPVICPIVLLGIKRLSTDFSPYVRRTAARAIGKCYSLAPELKEGLVEIIVEMLRDKSTLAIGSVVTAFGEVLLAERCDDRPPPPSTPLPFSAVVAVATVNAVVTVDAAVVLDAKRL